MTMFLEPGICFVDYSDQTSVEAFYLLLARAPKSALLLDFDGTLAPFEIDPSNVRPWSQIPELLQQIQDAGRTHLAVVTGRPAQEVRQLLPLREPLDIWGAHGAERIHPNGKLEREELPHQDIHALADAQRLLRSLNLPEGIRIEKKWNAIALHWRGYTKRKSKDAWEYAEKMLLPFTCNSGLQVLPFDGGMELRSGRNKGDAVRGILDELAEDAPVAYLGDDITDEDAFQVLQDRGLCALVRPRWRSSSAHIWLRAPAKLRQFLNGWQQALR